MVDLPVSAALSALSASLVGKNLFVHNNWVLNVNLYQVLGALPSSKKDAVIMHFFKRLHLISTQYYEKYKKETIKIESKIDSLSQSYQSIELKISRTEDQEKIKMFEKELEALNEEITENNIKKIMKWSIISGDITP